MHFQQRIRISEKVLLLDPYQAFVKIPTTRECNKLSV